MKNKISILCLSALIIFFTSCKKESQVSIVGQWRSISIYTMQDNGTYNWMPVGDRFPYFYTFSNEGRFSGSSDVPGRSGNYNYDEVSQSLILYNEADRYGNLPGTTSFKVETLDRDKLILSHPSSNLKTEYSRIK